MPIKKAAPTCAARPLNPAEGHASRSRLYSSSAEASLATPIKKAAPTCAARPLNPAEGHASRSRLYSSSAEASLATPTEKAAPTGAARPLNPAEGHASRSRLYSRRPRYSLVVYRPLAKFFRDRGPHLAAMIAYFALLSFVPLTFLALSLLGLTGRANESSYLVTELK